MKITIPIKTVSETNQREHWAIKARRVKNQRANVALSMCGRNIRRAINDLFGEDGKPCKIILTRIGKRKLDGDNLQSSFKAIRDEVATQLGADDGDSRFTWEYDQRIGKEYGIVIELVF